MLTTDQLEKVQRELFSQPQNNVYAIVDGAACPELRFKLYEWQPLYACLWSGKLQPDMEEVAPYMVKLEKASVFTEWLINHGHDKPWNIFVESALSPGEFRKQIRKLNMVRTPGGQNMVFRYYDPRVLNVFIESIERNQESEFFDGVNCFWIFDNLKKVELHRYERSQV